MNTFWNDTSKRRLARLAETDVGVSNRPTGGRQRCAVGQPRRPCHPTVDEPPLFPSDDGANAGNKCPRAAVQGTHPANGAPPRKGTRSRSTWAGSAREPLKIRRIHRCHKPHLVGPRNGVLRHLSKGCGPVGQISFLMRGGLWI